MQIEDLPGNHPGAEVIREVIESDYNPEAARWFESRYIELIEEEADSKDDAREVASRELQERMWELESTGSREERAQISVFKTETQIHREIADLVPPEESEDPEE